jgi:hypothetical protein
MVSENVATAAEELAAQAEQLQKTMLFFSIDEPPRPPSKGANKTKQETRHLQRESTPETTMDTQTHREVEGIEPNEEPSSDGGEAPDLDYQEEPIRDEQDNEFERY